MEKTRVRVVFLSLPIGTQWVSEENPESPQNRGRYFSENRFVYYREKLSDLESEDLEFVGKDLIRTEADLDGIAEKVKREDGVVAFMLTIYPRGLQEVISWGKPTILVNTVFEIPYIYNFGPARGKKNVIPVSSSDFADVGRKLRVIKAIAKLGKTKVLYHGRQSPGHLVKQAKENLGVEIHQVKTERFIEAYKAADEKGAKRLAEQWIRNAEEVVEPTKKDVVESCKLYYGIRKIMEEENAQVLAEGTFCMARKTDIPFACLVLAQLDDEGLAGVCQADLGATLTKLMVGYIADKPGFVANLHADTAENLVGLAHCTAPTKMDGPKNEAESYVIRNHQGLYVSVSLDVRMKVGQKVTIASFDPPNRILAYTGVIASNINVPHRNCRTYVAVKVEDANKLLKNYMCLDYPSTGHKVLFYGDWTEEIRNLAQILELEFINEMG